jgi:hypothetical protein
MSVDTKETQPGLPRFHPCRRAHGFHRARVPPPLASAGGLWYLETVKSDSAEEIERLITSDQSPVGIDAKKTHVIIIQKLIRIEERLARLERRVRADEAPE